MAILGPSVTSRQGLDQMLPGSWPLIRGTEIKVYTGLQRSKVTLFKCRATVQIRKRSTVKIDSGPHE